MLSHFHMETIYGLAKWKKIANNAKLSSYTFSKMYTNHFGAKKKTLSVTWINTDGLMVIFNGHNVSCLLYGSSSSLPLYCSVQCDTCCHFLLWRIQQSCPTFLTELTTASDHSQTFERSNGKHPLVAKLWKASVHSPPHLLQKILTLCTIVCISTMWLLAAGN